MTLDVLLSVLVPVGANPNPDSMCFELYSDKDLKSSKKGWIQIRDAQIRTPLNSTVPFEPKLLSDCVGWSGIHQARISLEMGELLICIISQR